ncbi:MAG: hypothetical protein A2X64_02680 [Ignavibacteria bacterium GWF2_33_9]|nr:MAG: hypothetical protein A2X64_02680 [Ignavibacteria bacterium GWF2_33_9]
MKKYIIYPLLFIFFTFFVKVNAMQDSLIVKLNKSSKINLDKNIIKQFSLRNLIRPQLLASINNSKENNQTLSNSCSNLSRIFILKYQSDIPKKKIIDYLQSTKQFEYVEEIPERHLFLIPNDSLFSEQYYFDLLQISEAWDSIKVKTQIIVGVVDTGVDYDHPDLNANIWNNPGETGLDKYGEDKRFNNIDDDENGFIDDWHGWDFVSDSLGEDNDPFPGHGHGTHVSGTIAAVINNTIGVAGMCDSIKILPIKAAQDSPFSTSVENTYEGILYAAKMGAKVINCSWGGSSKSIAEQEVIKTAIELGTIICAAAGNSGIDGAFYPAAYDGVISVAATDQVDEKASFSNYNTSVDVSAPGVDIRSTTPWNTYSSWNGTSMASPIASGVTAMIRMVHPEYTPIQAGEHLKATATSVDSINPFFKGKLGRGRVNALQAVITSFPKSLIVRNMKITNELNSNRFISSMKCNISVSIENVLSNINDLKIKVECVENPETEFIPNIINYGAFDSNLKTELQNCFEFYLPVISMPDYQFTVNLYFYDADTLLNQTSSSIIINPSFLDFKNNKISTTFNSRGNIAFNDYPENTQGIGFKYLNSDNLLYEGSLMICRDTLLSDVARSGIQDVQNQGFQISKQLEYLPIMNPTLLEGSTDLEENMFLLQKIGLKVHQTIYQNKFPDNTIYSIYDIINLDDVIKDSVYLGLYFDWDIGISGLENQTYWDHEHQAAIVYNALVDSLPKIAITMLSNHKNNYWAIDNDGTSEDNPGVWDGFLDNEKIRLLKSGIGRDTSGTTDVSVVLSAGPIFLDRLDTARVTFALTADDTIENLNKSIINSRTFSAEANLDNSDINKPVSKSIIKSIYPNPVRNNETPKMIFEIKKDGFIQIALFDLFGRKVRTLISGNYDAGRYIYTLDYLNLPIGAYFIRLENKSATTTYPIIIY